MRPTSGKKLDRTEAGIAAAAKRAKQANREPSTRLFLGKIPLAVDAARLEAALESKIKVLQWIHDRETGFFYGSAFVELPTLKDAKKAEEKASIEGVKVDGKRLRVNFAPPQENVEWPPKGHKHYERSGDAFGARRSCYSYE